MRLASHTARLSSRRRRSNAHNPKRFKAGVALAMAMVLVGMARIHSTSATFTDTTTNINNTFASATLYYSAVVAADNPLGYWRFDEVSGTSATDRSGNAWTGTYVSGAALRQTGGLTADPSTSMGVDGNGAGMTAADRNDFVNNSPFSLEAWAYATLLGVSGDYRTIVRKFNSSSGYWLYYSPDYGIGFERGNVGSTTAGTVEKLFTAATGLTNAWHHVVAT